MQYRTLGRTGWDVSTVSFGAWAIGGSWGGVDDEQSMRALHAACDAGVNFFDTADVYGDGRSERLMARLKRERGGDTLRIATKAGRRLNPHTAGGYNKTNLAAFVERSLQNLDTDCLDLVQLHCPPTDVYYQPATFAALDDLKQAGKLQHYGVSVARVEEALKAMAFPGVQSVQIIFNMLRHRPSGLLFDEAKKHRVGILARVPLASGLLTGKMTKQSAFAADDHRQFNRRGEAFDVGETFSGVDFETGLRAAEELKALCPAGASLTQFALRWITMFDAVTCAIPGAKTVEQAEQNAAAADLPGISPDVMAKVRDVYERLVAPTVHQRW